MLLDNVVFIHLVFYIGKFEISKLINIKLKDTKSPDPDLISKDALKQE